MDKKELAVEHHMIQHGLSVGKAQSHADLTLEHSEKQSCLFAEWAAQNYHHSVSLKGEHFWENKSLPRKAGNSVESTVDIYKKFKQ